MKNALIGFSGYVGTTLLKQSTFDELFRSTNIDQIAGKRFSTVICAGAPAQKWIANKEPEADRAAIEKLIGHLKTIACARFVLISTVDVFQNPLGADEDSPVPEDGLHAYGLNRRLLEKFVESHFDNTLIIRLPGLVGPGLKKNIVFDLLNDNNLASIDSRGSFQFYPMVNLWHDIQIALQAGLKLVHLAAEPIAVSQVANLGFNKLFDNPVSPTPAKYDIQSKHAVLFGGNGRYQYSQRDTLQAIRAYAQSECPVAAARHEDAR
jgi:nucleoside-diphosphate-sugar epimerase